MATLAPALRVSAPEMGAEVPVAEPEPVAPPALPAEVVVGRETPVPVG